MDGFQYLENTKSGDVNEAAFADLEISVSLECAAFGKESNVIAKPTGIVTDHQRINFDKDTIKNHYKTIISPIVYWSFIGLILEVYCRYSEGDWEETGESMEALW